MTLSKNFFKAMAGMEESRVAHVNLNKRLEETGERERLKQEFAKKLIRTRGWRDELMQLCIEYLKNKGVERVTVDEIVAKIAPQGRATVPESLKEELLNKIRTFAEENRVDIPVTPKRRWARVQYPKRR